MDERLHPENPRPPHHRQRWGAEDLACLVRLHEQRAGVDQIAQLLGRSAGSVRRRLARMQAQPGSASRGGWLRSVSLDRPSALDD